MWSVPVVLMDPPWQLLGALVGVLIGTAISPFAQGGLDEAFCFSVGAGSVGPCAAMLEAELLAGLGEATRGVGGPVVVSTALKRMPSRA